MIYLKGEGYAKGSAFGNPTIIGAGTDEVEQALKHIKTLLEVGRENKEAIVEFHISFDKDRLKSCRGSEARNYK
tara:strand:+ start:325 stop:546 length:222 start_codon:yes stop_codon:yes gene_type:complete